MKLNRLAKKNTNAINTGIVKIFICVYPFSKPGSVKTPFLICLLKWDNLKSASLKRRQW